MNKQLVLFDLDGTISDPKVGITKSVAYSLAHFGIEVKDPDDLVAFIGPPLRDSYVDFYSFSEQDAERAVAKFREYFTPKGIFENTLYPGMKDLLQSLSESGHRLMIASSKPTVFAEQILEYFHIRPYFGFVSGCEMDGRNSKKSQVIARALAQAGPVQKEEIIMVGDRRHDVLGAAEHGVRCVGVAYGYGGREELISAGAAYVVDSVEELGELLLKL